MYPWFKWLQVTYTFCKKNKDQNREIARSSFDSQLHWPPLVNRGKAIEKLENENNKIVEIQSEIIKWFWENWDTQVFTSHNSIKVYHCQTLFPHTCSVDWDFSKRCRAQGEIALPQVQYIGQCVIKEEDLTDPIQSVHC
jgi:hypothetical protein